MFRRLFILTVPLIAAALPPSAVAQSWPTRPIRVLVGFAPGGTSDLSARVVGDIMAKELGQSVIVENRPGGSGSVAIEAVIRGAADGHTIVVVSDSAFYQPVLRPSLAYRSERDLRPVAILTNQPIVIAVHPAPGWKSIADLLKAAKARPGEIAYALSSATGTQAVAAGIFFSMAKVKMVAIPYKGGGQAVVDLVSGQVPVAVLGTTPLVPQARAGRIKLIAVTSKVRAKALPDVPALAEVGFPDMDISQWFGAMVPAGTPDEVVARLSATINKALSDPKVAQRLFDVGLEVVGGSPQEMARRMSAEMGIWAKAAKEAGLASN
ncbi:MAG: tripartite tricarboxylate transporter substrate binding protein [Betaproteobacteria bacterium]|nr:tripartite tricarboxylate transporter substrate binding protein [Betaproteobacteria bacterium]